MAEVKSIKFGLLSPYQIKKMSSVVIEKPVLYDTDGFPVDGGLADLKLGVVDPGLRCNTCYGRIGECQGHFGYIELVKPVINPLFGKFIYMLLKTTCRSCGKFLTTDEKFKLKELYSKTPKKCTHCGEEQKEIKFQKPTMYFEGKNELNPEQIRERLENIPDEELEKIGFEGRPEWMVLTLLPVPPVTVRPSIVLETGERSEDDLTHKLMDILRINERMKRNIELGAPQFIIDDIWELLQYHVSTYINNEISTLPPARHRSGRALKTLVQRLTKKEGRFRGNLAGKRVNFSARTVVSPDPFLSINEVGVPEMIASVLTVPERVTERNIEKLRKIILSDEHGKGANYVIRPDGTKKKITPENKEAIAEELAPGYIVERHLMDGDIVLFNRQPSLHRMSIMAHRVRVMPYKTFRLNLCETIPYNADFDGDEMNLHVPQTEEARIEAEELMLVEKNIRSPRYGLPVIAFKHDHITGLYLLTRKETVVDKEFVAMVREFFGIDMPVKQMKGKELFSYFLPDGLSIEFKAAKYDESDPETYVVIKNGRLLQGVIDENALGERKGKLLNIIELKYGHERARQFLDDVSRLSLLYLTRRGFSISVSDYDMDPSMRKDIRKVIEKGRRKAEEAVRKYLNGEIRPMPGLTARETFEMEMQAIANEIMNDASRVVRKYVNPETSSYIMAVSGARGSLVNITQTVSLLGQETLSGKRISRGYRGRTTSHFRKGDVGLEARGFVFRGYGEGLHPIEFFFDAMNSRENLMDKSLQTRHSGYMERRLVNALQDLKVEYDGTVRDSSGMIIQFRGGGDGLDPAKLDNGKINPEVFE